MNKVSVKLLYGFRGKFGGECGGDRTEKRLKFYRKTDPCVTEIEKSNAGAESKVLSIERYFPLGISEQKTQIAV